MTALIVVLLIVVGGLLAWVVKLLLSMPRGQGLGRNVDTGFENIIVQSGTGVEPDIQEVADRLLHRIDRRIEALRDLISQADSRIEALKQTNYVLPAEYPTEDANRSNRKNIDKGSLKNRKRARIIALRRKGMAPAVIAREVEMGLGEVELILKIEGYGS